MLNNQNETKIKDLREQEAKELERLFMQTRIDAVDLDVLEMVFSRVLHSMKSVYLALSAVYHVGYV